MTCLWCKRYGKINLIGFGEKICPNCLGAGEGADGGEIEKEEGV